MINSLLAVPQSLVLFKKIQKQLNYIDISGELLFHNKYDNDSLKNLSQEWQDAYYDLDKQMEKLLHTKVLTKDTSIYDLKTQDFKQECLQIEQLKEGYPLLNFFVIPIREDLENGHMDKAFRKAYSFVQHDDFYKVKDNELFAHIIYPYIKQIFLYKALNNTLSKKELDIFNQVEVYSRNKTSIKSPRTLYLEIVEQIVFKEELNAQKVYPILEEFIKINPYAQQEEYTLEKDDLLNDTYYCFPEHFNNDFCYEVNKKVSQLNTQTTPKRKMRA